MKNEKQINSRKWQTINRIIFVIIALCLFISVLLCIFSNKTYAYTPENPNIGGPYLYGASLLVKSQMYYSDSTGYWYANIPQPTIKNYDDSYMFSNYNLSHLYVVVNGAQLDGFDFNPTYEATIQESSWFGENVFLSFELSDILHDEIFPYFPGSMYGEWVDCYFIITYNDIIPYDLNLENYYTDGFSDGLEFSNNTDPDANFSKPVQTVISSFLTTEFIPGFSFLTLLIMCLAVGVIGLVIKIGGK